MSVASFLALALFVSSPAHAAFATGGGVIVQPESAGGYQWYDENFKKNELARPRGTEPDDDSCGTLGCEAEGQGDRNDPMNDPGLPEDSQERD